MLLESLTAFNNVGYKLDMKGKTLKLGTSLLSFSVFQIFIFFFWELNCKTL